MLSLVKKLLVLLIVLYCILLLLAIIGVSPFVGCFLRHPNLDGTSANTKSVTLRANGNYGASLATDTNGSYICLKYDDSGICISKQYTNSNQGLNGQWLNSGLSIVNGSRLTFSVSGEVSLCQANYANDSSVQIPRVDNNNSNLGLPVVLDAATMRSADFKITEVYVNDKIQVRVGPNYNQNNITIINPSNSSQPHTADCLDGKISYSGLCGKYSFYVNAPYLASCDSKTNVGKKTGWRGNYDDVTPLQKQGYNCVQTSKKGCEGLPPLWIGYCYKYTCTKYTTALMPLAYASSGVFLDLDSIDQRSPYNPGRPNNTCPTLPSSNDLKSWFTFDKIGSQKTASALSYSISNSSISGNATILDDCPAGSTTGCHQFSDRYIFDQKISKVNKATGNYLSYKFFDIGSGAGGYTGGYLLYVKQTKCYRENGQYFSDSFVDRGKILYLITDGVDDPNKLSTLASNAKPLNFDVNGYSTSVVNADKNGSLWVLINNAANDYANSSGAYNLSITQLVDNSSSPKIDMWSWISDLFVKKYQDTSKQIFKNLTCYGADDKSGCTNLFNVVRAILILYIMILGMMFALGMLKINQIDLIIKVIKIILVGGLINENTFNFFNTYLFDLIFNASNEIMGSIVSSNGDFSNTLSAFFSEIYDVIAKDIFQLQLLALLGTGLSGIICFFVILISLIFFLIAVFDFIVVYLVSCLAVAVLLSLAPIFLIFMLFNFTRYLFDNWLKFILGYIFEPIIIFVGVASLAKLFLIYIDYILGFSVCWKCNMPFQIPFLSSLFPFLKDFDKVPIFCIYWLSPWGYDPISYNFAMGFVNVIGLFMVSFIALRYSQLSTQITEKLFGLSDKTSASKKAKNLALSNEDEK
jgi:type IV secretion system protein VirB6